jgi:hypothetical protein
VLGDQLRGVVRRSPAGASRLRPCRAAASSGGASPAAAGAKASPLNAPGRRFLPARYSAWRCIESLRVADDARLCHTAVVATVEGEPERGDWVSSLRVSAAMMGERLNPLAMSQIPSDSSQTNSGTVNRAPTAEVCPQRPNTTATPDAKHRGPPTRPSRAKRRGTRPDLNNQVAQQQPVPEA